MSQKKQRNQGVNFELGELYLKGGEILQEIGSYTSRYRR